MTRRPELSPASKPVGKFPSLLSLYRILSFQIGDDQPQPQFADNPRQRRLRTIRVKPISLPRSRAGTNSDINGQMEYSAPIAMPIIRRLQQLKGSELVTPFEPLDNNDLLALGDDVPGSGVASAFAVPSGQSRDWISLPQQAG